MSNAYLRAFLLICVFVVSVEVSARVHDYLRWGANLVQPYDSSMLRVAEGGFAICRENVKFEKWDLDENGFRRVGGENKDQGRVAKVAVLGSSEAFGLFESEGNEFPSQLQKMLRSSQSCGVRIINASCPGASLATSSYLFAAKLAQLNPDIVLLYPTPQLYLDAHVPGTPVISIRRSVVNNVRVVRTLKRMVKQLLPETWQTWIRKKEVDRTSAQANLTEVWDSPPSVRKNAFESDLRALVDSIKKAGVTPILATHASRFGETPGEVEDASREYMWRKSYPRATLDALVEFDRFSNQLTRQMGENLGIPVADVASFVGNDALHFADFSHFTDQGAKRAAQAFIPPLEDELAAICSMD